MYALKHTFSQNEAQIYGRELYVGSLKVKAETTDLRLYEKKNFFVLMLFHDPVNKPFL